MHGILVVKILIKVAIPAPVFVGAWPEVNASLKMVDARSLAGRKFLQFIFPGDDMSALPMRGDSFFPQVPVLLGHTPQCLIKATCRAIIVAFAILEANDTGLRPDTGTAFLFLSILQAG
jgi:hypothetical protein